MKYYKIILTLGSLISLQANAGHINVDNHANTAFEVLCGHDGDLGRSYLIEPDHNTQMDVYGDHHGKANCQAIDHHGNVLATRNFDFHHGNESYQWQVTHHDSNTYNGYNGGSYSYENNSNSNNNNHNENSNNNIVLCESINSHRQTCSIPHDSNVSFYRQISRSSCNRNWGFNANSVWVVNGCRAEFTVDPKH